jgi:hypothetical protein
MSRYYFEVDRVVSIRFYPEKETGYKWFERVPSKPKTFLGIKYGMTEEIPEGWSDYENGRYRKTLQELREDNRYLINERTEEVRHKSQIIVNLTDKTSYNQYFNTEEEGEDYMYGLQESTGKEFYPIEN